VYDTSSVDAAFVTIAAVVQDEIEEVIPRGIISSQ
jgi:hypothetical protein